MAKAILTISSKNYGAWALRGWSSRNTPFPPMTRR